MAQNISIVDNLGSLTLEPFTMGDSTKPKSSSKSKDSKNKGHKTKDVARPAEKATDPQKPINSAKLPIAEPKKKKQKLTPEKPQPTWLFPSREDAPNPHSSTESERGKDLENWNAAINFLKHKAVTAPLKTPPPSQLLTMVGEFLTFIGFDSASRIFIVERNARKALDGWDDGLGKDTQEKGLPNLVKIYNDWFKGWQARKELDWSSREEKCSVVAKQSKKVPKKQKVENGKVVGKVDETSSSSSSDSSSESDSDLEMVDVIPGKEESKTKAKVDTSSGTSSSSDSDADDEKEATKIAAKAETTIPKKAAVNGQVKKAKREASPSSSSSSDTSSSDSEAGTRSTKGASASSSPDTSSSDSESDTISSKIPIPASALKPSSSSSSSDSDSDTKPVSKPSKSHKASTSGPITDSRKSSTDTSVTLPNGTTTNTPPLKRKRSLSPYSKRLPAVKVTKTSANESFSRVPKDTKVDVKLASNAYIPYDYAERAHQDLIVTKGKGFTKEKNKKKRGS